MDPRSSTLYFVCYVVATAVLPMLPARVTSQVQIPAQSTNLPFSGYPQTFSSILHRYSESLPQSPYQGFATAKLERLIILHPRRTKSETPRALRLLRTRDDDSDLGRVGTAQINSFVNDTGVSSEL